MANTTISPNMNMPIPTVSTDPGPDWATNIDASLNIVDSHNHTTGQGVQITPGGININQDLPMNGNNLTTARTIRFTAQGTTIPASGSDLGCIYESGVDLYYNDGAGNQVRITQSGSVSGASGTITGLPSGTASASFSGGTFTFQSATNTPATMAVGPLVIGRNSPLSKTVTVQPNSSQASNFNMTLPIANPASNAFLVIDSSGNMSTTLISTITSGTFTPTVTWSHAVTVNGQIWYYQRNGTNVTVTGEMNITSLTNGTTFTSATLPIATASLSVVGTIISIPNTTSANTSQINTVSNSGTTLVVITTGSTGPANSATGIFQFNYTYQVS